MLSANQEKTVTNHELDKKNELDKKDLHAFKFKL